MSFEMMRLRREQKRLDRLIRGELNRRRPDFARIAELRRIENEIAGRVARLAREHGLTRRSLLGGGPAYA